MKDKLPYIVIIGFTALIGFFLFEKKGDSKTKIGYVFIETLFSEFKLKKELETNFLKANQIQNRLLDSLKFELIKLKDSKNETEKYNYLLENLNKKHRVISNDQQIRKEQSDKLIIERLNQYINEFGKEKGYDLIISTGGDNVLLYADSTLNLTKDIIEFSNRKYDGKI